MVVGCEGVGKTTLIHHVKQGRTSSSTSLLKRTESQQGLGSNNINNTMTSSSASAYNLSSSGEFSSSSNFNANNNNSGTGSGIPGSPTSAASISNLLQQLQLTDQQLLEVTRWEPLPSIDPSGLVFDFWDCSGKEGME